MWQSLSNLAFGDSRVTLVLLIAVGLLVVALLAYLVYRIVFAHRISAPGAPRGRAPRLGVVDVFELDGQRQLVIIRRDNVEHLLMIGGPNDLVVEAEIMRSAANGPAVREGAKPQTPEPAVEAAPPPHGPRPVAPAPRRNPVRRLEPVETAVEAASVMVTPENRPAAEVRGRPEPVALRPAPEPVVVAARSSGEPTLFPAPKPGGDPVVVSTRTSAESMVTAPPRSQAAEPIVAAVRTTVEPTVALPSRPPVAETVVSQRPAESPPPPRKSLATPKPPPPAPRPNLPSPIAPLRARGTEPASGDAHRVAPTAEVVVLKPGEPSIPPVVAAPAPAVATAPTPIVVAPPAAAPPTPPAVVYHAPVAPQAPVVAAAPVVPSPPPAPPSVAPSHASAAATTAGAVAEAPGARKEDFYDLESLEAEMARLLGRDG